MSLISTSDIRIWLSIEEGDVKPNTKLNAVAQAVEDFVESYTNRVLQARTYTDDFQYSILDGNGKDWIYLPVFPVSYVSSVYVNADHIFDSASLMASADFYWYSNGKVVTEDGYFSRGRRNVRIDYTAGFGAIVGGTYGASAGSYPLPLDLKQVMLEMCVEVYKEGATAIHTVESSAGEVKFINMLGRNSFWRTVLGKYKNLAGSFLGKDE